MQALPPCQLCSRPIQSQTETETDGRSDTSDLDETDGIQLSNCNHTFHWSCWATYESQDRVNRASCPAPNCGAHTLTYSSSAQSVSGSSSQGQGTLFVTLYNEGGTTPHFDLGQALDDEQYYDTHPTAKLARAFRSMVVAGDFEAARDIMTSEDWKDLGLNVDCLDEREEGGTGGLSALELALGREDEEAARALIAWGASLPQGTGRLVG